MIPIPSNRGAAVVAQICQNSFQLSPTNMVKQQPLPGGNLQLLDLHSDHPCLSP